MDFILPGFIKLFLHHPIDKSIVDQSTKSYSIYPFLLKKNKQTHKIKDAETYSFWEYRGLFKFRLLISQLKLNFRSWGPTVFFWVGQMKFLEQGFT